MGGSKTASGPGAFSVGRGGQFYALFLFWLASAFSFLDRQVLAVLLNSIKAEFSLTDTQLGLLGGFAFGLFYSVMGLPLARLVDRFNRKNILAGAVAAWSMMTMVCGTATSFIGLFFARAGVAVGEAGGAPSISSMLSDYFSPARRGFAFAVLNMAIPVSIMIGYVVGGMINQHYGWRVTFAAVGAPGLVLAIIILLTLREPPRGYSEARTDRGDAPSLGAGVRILLARPSYRWLALGGSLVSMGIWGAGLWLPSFYERVHQMNPAQAAGMIGLIFGLCGTIGTLGGGYASDWLVRRTGERSRAMLVPAIALAITVPLGLVTFLTQSPMLSLACLAVFVLFFHMQAGPLHGTLQGLAELRLRGMSTALFFFINNLIATGLGPLLIGMASDRLGVDYGVDALRYAILGLVLCCYGGAALCFLRVGRFLGRDLAAADAA